MSDTDTADEPQGDVRLKVVAPSWCTGMSFPVGDGGTLDIDRQGVVVPAKDAKALIDQAAKSGVTLMEVSE